MKFDLVLFDIDGTLLDFDLAEKNALADTLNEYNFICNDEILNRYHEINIFYWKQLEKGLVDKKQLAYKRYEQLFSEYGIETDIDTFNFKYRNRLKEGAYLLDILIICLYQKRLATINLTKNILNIYFKK